MGAREMTQQLKAFASLSEGSGLVPSIHGSTQLSSYKGSDIIILPLVTLEIHMIHRYI